MSLTRSSQSTNKIKTSFVETSESSLYLNVSIGEHAEIFPSMIMSIWILSINQLETHLYFNCVFAFLSLLVEKEVIFYV